MAQSKAPQPEVGSPPLKQRTPLEFLWKILGILMLVAAGLGALFLVFIIFLRVFVGGFMGHP